MTELAHALAGESSRRTNKCDAKNFWRDLFVGIWPDKTDASVSFFAKTSVGAARHVLRGRNGISGSALVNLLRSPVGQRVLDAIVADVDWRAAERRLLEIEQLRRELARLEQKRSDLDRDLSRNQ